MNVSSTEISSSDKNRRISGTTDDQIDYDDEDERLRTRVEEAISGDRALTPSVFVPNPPPPSPRNETVHHFRSKTVDVIEEFYGTHVDAKGTQHQIKKFTWRNYNKIVVSVINYGARIISMKIPDKKGRIADVLLGYEDLIGHVRNADHPLGACLGRCAGAIKNASFHLDREFFPLTKNVTGRHHLNGGRRGFDKQVFAPYVDKSKVIMTYVGAHKEEGYPGHIFVKLTFELRDKNRFCVEYEAHSSAPTVVNLTHHCYFNLAGSNQGPKEIYHHLLTLNANCYTVQELQTPGPLRLPTGEIRNVVNTKHDFQIPKCLSKVIGVKPGDGYDQNYCVNRGSAQNECFVSRLFHPPSGRMLEVYSSHKGVLFKTGNEFGTGALAPIEKLLEKPFTCSTTSLIVGHVYRNLKELLNLDDHGKNYFEMRDLIDLVKQVELGDTKNLENLELTQLQRRYLERIYHHCSNCEKKFEKCERIIDAIQTILREASPPELTESRVLAPETDETNDETTIREKIYAQFASKITDLAEENEGLDEQEKKLKVPKKIIGKNGYWYEAHCGVAVVPGAYPDAANLDSFPDVVLRPGQVYRESTSFRFWVRAGNPNNWIKRKQFESTYVEKRAAKLAEQTEVADILGFGLQER